MTNVAVLNASRTNYDAVKEKLLEQWEGLRDDEVTLHDTLDGETDLVDHLIAIIRSSEMDQILIDGIKERIRELGERAKRLGYRIESKKGLVADAMGSISRRSIEAPDFTISLANSPKKVVITDEKEIPEQFMDKPTPPDPKPDKEKIKEALNNNKIGRASCRERV